MRILVTGSAGHLCEALMRSLQGAEHEVVGLDVNSSACTERVGSITERSFVRSPLAIAVGSKGYHLRSPL